MMKPVRNTHSEPGLRMVRATLITRVEIKCMLCMYETVLTWHPNTILHIIVSITKFSIVIGSPHAYLSRNRGAITWVCNYRCPIWTFLNRTPVIGYPRDFHVNYARSNGFLSSVFGSCAFCAPLDRYIGRHLVRHIDRHSTDVSVDISVECRSIMRPRCVGRGIDPGINRDIDRLSADISVDIAVNTHFTIYLPFTFYLQIYPLYLICSADTLSIGCRRNIGRPSVVYRSKA